MSGYPSIKMTAKSMHQRFSEPPKATIDSATKY